MKYLLDTNICIYALKGTFPALNRKLLSVHPDDIAVSSITVAELEYGAAKNKWGEKARNSMYAFLANFEIIPFTDSDAAVFGQFKAYVESIGLPVGICDVMIAAQGMSGNYTVVTHNTGEFCRFKDLLLEDWATEV